MNFAITFKNLSEVEKRNIYRTFIGQIDEEKLENRQALLNWVDGRQFTDDQGPFKRLNGRQIRNVLFSAASIAQQDGSGRLRIEHIEDILRQTVRFQEDVESMMEKAREKAEVGISRDG